MVGSQSSLRATVVAGDSPRRSPAAVAWAATNRRRSDQCVAPSASDALAQWVVAVAVVEREFSWLRRVAQHELQRAAAGEVAVGEPLPYGAPVERGRLHVDARRRRV